MGVDKESLKEPEMIGTQNQAVVDYLHKQVAVLQKVMQNMATQHVYFYGPEGEQFHPDWCPLCRIEKSEEIGSPVAIADWIEQQVIPMLGVKMNLPEISVKKGAVHIGGTIKDLIEAIRDS